MQPSPESSAGVVAHVLADCDRQATGRCATDVLAAAAHLKRPPSLSRGPAYYDGAAPLPPQSPQEAESFSQPPCLPGGGAQTPGASIIPEDRRPLPVPSQDAATSSAFGWELPAPPCPADDSHMQPTFEDSGLWDGSFELGSRVEAPAGREDDSICSFDSAVHRWSLQADTAAAHPRRQAGIGEGGSNDNAFLDGSSLCGWTGTGAEAKTMDSGFHDSGFAEESHASATESVFLGSLRGNGLAGHGKEAHAAEPILDGALVVLPPQQMAACHESEQPHRPVCSPRPEPGHPVSQEPGCLLSSPSHVATMAALPAAAAMGPEETSWEGSTAAAGHLESEGGAACPAPALGEGHPGQRGHGFRPRRHLEGLGDCHAPEALQPLSQRGTRILGAGDPAALDRWTHDGLFADQGGFYGSLPGMPQDWTQTTNQRREDGAVLPPHLGWAGEAATGHVVPIGASEGGDGCLEDTKDTAAAIPWEAPEGEGDLYERGGAAPAAIFLAVGHENTEAGQPQWGLGAELTVMEGASPLAAPLDKDASKGCAAAAAPKSHDAAVQHAPWPSQALRFLPHNDTTEEGSEEIPAPVLSRWLGGEDVRLAEVQDERDGNWTVGRVAVPHGAAKEGCASDGGMPEGPEARCRPPSSLLGAADLGEGNAAWDPMVLPHWGDAAAGEGKWDAEVPEGRLALLLQPPPGKNREPAPRAHEDGPASWAPVLSRWGAQEDEGAADGPEGPASLPPLMDSDCSGSQHDENTVALPRWHPLGLPPLDTSGKGQQPHGSHRDSAAAAVTDRLHAEDRHHSLEESAAESSGFLDLMDIASAAAALEPVEAMEPPRPVALHSHGSGDFLQGSPWAPTGLPPPAREWAGFPPAPDLRRLPVNMVGERPGSADMDASTPIRSHALHRWPAADGEHGIQGQSAAPWLLADETAAPPLTPTPGDGLVDGGFAQAAAPQQDGTHILQPSLGAHGIAVAPAPGEWAASPPSCEAVPASPSSARLRPTALEGELLMSAHGLDYEEGCAVLEQFLETGGLREQSRWEDEGAAVQAPQHSPTLEEDTQPFTGTILGIEDWDEPEDDLSSEQEQLCRFLLPEGLPAPASHALLLPPEQPQAHSDAGFAALRPASPTITWGALPHSHGEEGMDSLEGMLPRCRDSDGPGRQLPLPLTQEAAVYNDSGGEDSSVTQPLGRFSDFVELGADMMLTHDPGKQYALPSTIREDHSRLSTAAAEEQESAGLLLTSTAGDLHYSYGLRPVDSPQENLLHKLFGNLCSAPAQTAGPSEASNGFLRDALSPQLGVEPGSPGQHLEGLALLNNSRLAELLAASMDELPTDDPEAICASLLGTLIGLRESAAVPPLEPCGSVEVHVNLTSPRPAEEAKDLSYPSPQEAPWRQSLSAAAASASHSSSELPLKLLEKAVEQPERVLGKLLEWAEDCGLDVGGTSPPQGDSSSSTTAAKPLERRWSPGPESSHDFTAMEAVEALDRARAVGQAGEPGRARENGEGRRAVQSRLHNSPGGPPQPSGSPHQDVSSGCAGPRRTLAQRLILTDALPPRRPPAAAALRPQHDSSGFSDFDRDIRFDTAGRAALLRAILTKARKRAERHVRTAEEQVCHSTATHQRIREIRKVMAGGADAAFSLTVDMGSPRLLWTSPSSFPKSPQPSLQAAGLTPMPSPSSSYGLRERHRTLSRTASPALAIHTAPAGMGGAPSATPPTLEDMTSGVASPDAVAANEFAAQYSTAAVNTQLRNVRDLTANFRAELHSVALRTDSALKRSRPSGGVMLRTAGPSSADPASTRRRLNMTTGHI